MLVCAFSCATCTRDRGCSAHPVFPAPSVERGWKVTQGLILKARALRAARMRTHILKLFEIPIWGTVVTALLHRPEAAVERIRRHDRRGAGDLGGRRRRRRSGGVGNRRLQRGLGGGLVGSWLWG